MDRARGRHIRGGIEAVDKVDMALADKIDADVIVFPPCDTWAKSLII